MRVSNPDITIQQLLKRFPDGFSVSKTGNIYEVVKASGTLTPVAEEFPLAPENGGYLVIRVPIYKDGDSEFGIEEEDLGLNRSELSTLKSNMGR